MPFKEILIKNTVFKPKEDQPTFAPVYEAPSGSLLERLHNSRKLIQEKAYGNISAFNFTREVFNSGKWNDLTTKARGLFLDNTNGRIVARGFEKFFGYKERQFNSDQFLKEHLQYPVSAYVKYNGFLGILGFDDGGLLFCSKSTVGGEYAEYFKEIFSADDHNISELVAYMRKKNLGLVFEVIDPVNDPHIVEYGKKAIVLLDAIALDEKFSNVAYDDLVDLAHKFNFNVKVKWEVFYDWEHLHEFLQKCDNDAETHREGFVMVDANGYQFKLKGAWYRRWKMLRSIKDKIAQGHLVNIAGINSPMAVNFIGWAKNKGADYCKARSIIQLRNEFEREEHYNALPKYEVVASKLCDGEWVDQVHTGTFSELRLTFWHTLKMGNERSKEVDLYPAGFEELVESLNKAVALLGVADKNRYTGRELEG